MPPLSDASTHMKSLQAFQANQERERIATARVILRAIQQGTLGPSSPHAGKSAAEFEEHFFATPPAPLGLPG
jgi:hypothetical protein